MSGLRKEAKMIWHSRLNPLCWFCTVGRYHFCHSNGDVNTDLWTKADPKCDKCLMGKAHFVHDHTAFNQNEALKGDDYG